MSSLARITKPDSYNDRTFLPEKGGLYCEAVFGPVHWRAGERRLAEDSRAEGVGHIQLPVAVMRGGVAVEVVEVVPPVQRRFVEVSPDESRRQAYARREELVQLAQTSAWPDGWGTLEKVLIEEGLADEHAIAEIGVTWREPPLNIAYRAVVNRANRLERLIELDAPVAIYQTEHEALVARIAELDEALRVR